jgi:hypothetical protein
MSRAEGLRGSHRMDGTAKLSSRVVVGPGCQVDKASKARKASPRNVGDGNPLEPRSEDNQARG